MNAAAKRLAASRDRLLEALDQASSAPEPQFRAKPLIEFVIRRYPLQLALSAVTLGALAVGVRPWRLLSKPWMRAAVMAQASGLLAGFLEAGPTKNWADLLKNALDSPKAR